ncbi:hypothetical protein B0H12DRAFT_1240224 [Mycena haematopus]|nr:hypothetical protein B0H12DRAFT_1240224 [Mycena haematopus]
MSAPAALAQAHAQREDAHRALNAALNSSEEAAVCAAADHADQVADAARLATDALARPSSPSSHIYDRSNYPDDVFLGLRSAWRRHHQRQEEARGGIGRDVYERVGRCATFGELASLLEDEWAVSDDIFRALGNIWRDVQGRPAVPDADISELLDRLAARLTAFCSV